MGRGALVAFLIGHLAAEASSANPARVADIVEGELAVADIIVASREKVGNLCTTTSVIK